jgi:anaerobic selenocysteine-containing dehydrogenase
MTSTHFRTCNLCEAMCGLKIQVENDAVKSIEGDKNDSFSRGHICPKAVAMKDIYNDPNRLKTPVRRTADGWEPISWDDAYTEIVEKTKAIQAKHGNNAVGVYQGNPSIHNLGTTLNSANLFRLLRTKNMFSATSADQLPHHFAAWQMFGHPMLLPIPDIDNTDFWLIFGGNPIASNGSIMSAPDVAHRLSAIRQRGGKVIVVDPRRTETADKSSAHFFIRPNADVFLLLALIHVVYAKNGVKMDKNADYTEGSLELEKCVADFSPEAVAAVTGIAAAEIERLATDFMAAKTAVCYGRVGVSTQRFGTLCQWLINALNVLTGNCDSEGGAMFTAPAFEILRKSKAETIFNRWQSRVRGLPEFMSELPVAAMAEEILTEGEGQIKALITSCGNPVLSVPNGLKMDKALENLDFMVSFDIYINETTRHAHLILPPATGLEVSHYDVTFHVLAIRNTAKYSPPLFAKAEGAKYDWEIFQELAHRFKGETGDFKPEPPENTLDMGLKFGRYKISLQDLKDNPHGLDFGALQPCFPERLFTENKKINLAPSLLVADLERARKYLDADKNVHRTSDTVHLPYPFALIGRRHLRDNNSWMHNSERLVRGRNRCTLLIHTDDAKALNIDNQQVVKVNSRIGSVELPAELTDSMMRGVLCMPHGYGHGRAKVQLDVARKNAGVSVNDLTDEYVLDDLTGNAAFSNVFVNVELVS